MDFGSPDDKSSTKSFFFDASKDRFKNKRHLPRAEHNFNVMRSLEIAEKRHQCKVDKVHKIQQDKEQEIKLKLEKEQEVIDNDKQEVYNKKAKIKSSLMEQIEKDGERKAAAKRETKENIRTNYGPEETLSMIHREKRKKFDQKKLIREALDKQIRYKNRIKKDPRINKI